MVFRSFVPVATARHATRNPKHDLSQCVSKRSKTEGERGSEQSSAANTSLFWSCQKVVDSAGSVQHKASSSKSTHASSVKCKTVVVSGHWMTGYKRPVKNLLAMLHVNHQLREEVLPIFSGNRTIEIHEHSIELPKTHNWLQQIPKEHLKHLRSIHIRLKNTHRRDYASPPCLYSKQRRHCQRKRKF